MSKVFTSQDLVKLWHLRQNHVPLKNIQKQFGVSTATVYFTEKRLSELLSKTRKPANTTKRYWDAIEAIKNEQQNKEDHKSGPVIVEKKAETLDPFERVDRCLAELLASLTDLATISNQKLTQENDELHQRLADITEENVELHQKVEKLEKLQEMAKKTNWVGTLRQKFQGK